AQAGEAAVLERARVHIEAEVAGGGHGERERERRAGRHRRAAEERGRGDGARAAHHAAAAEAGRVLARGEGGREEVLGLDPRPLEGAVEDLALAGLER